MIPTWQSDRKQTKSTCQHQKYLLSENGHLGSLVSKFALGPVLAWIAPFLSLNRTTVLTSQSKNSITSGWVSCITSPPETLPLSHLAEGGGGAPEEGLTQDRKEYGRAGQGSEMSQPAFPPLTDPTATAGAPACPAAGPSLHHTPLRVRNQSKQSLILHVTPSDQHAL